MSHFQSSRKINFIDTIPKSSIESESSTLATKCKFNFAYFDVQKNSQSFEDWTEKQRTDLFNKLKAYSSESLQHWKATQIGKKTGKVLSIYGEFPQNSDLQRPKHVPHDVEWGRFRLDYSSRLVGFILPEKYDEIKHKKTGKMFDCNTFYIVFLDENHCFCKSK